MTQIFSGSILGQGVENVRFRATVFEKITGGTSGVASPPTGHEIIIDSFPGDVDVLLSKSDATQDSPTGESVTDSGANILTGTMDVDGNWTISGTPSSYPFFLLYVCEAPVGRMTPSRYADSPLILASAGAIVSEAKFESHIALHSSIKEIT